MRDQIRFMILMILPLLLLTAAHGNDWPYWRGPEQTGMSREKAPVLKWTQDGENQLWKVPVGGRTTPVIMNGRLYTITPANPEESLKDHAEAAKLTQPASPADSVEREHKVATSTGPVECLHERVVCLDAETGKTIWEHHFNVFHTDIVEARVGWTAPVGDPETGNVYVHGTGGELFCFNKDGKVLWKKSLEEEFARYSGYGGRLHTPIIDEDKVIIGIVYILAGWDTGPRKSGHRYLAFDKKNGDLIYAAQPGGQPQDTTYSVPVVAVIGGKRMIVAGDADGNVYGMLARTGEKLWTFKYTKRGINTSVVVDGNYVYATHSEENLDNTVMGRVVCIDATKTGDITQTGEVWRADGIEAGYSSPAVVNGRLYVPTNGGVLVCLDAQSGKPYWQHDLGTVMKASPVVTADGVIYVGEVNGRFHILRDVGDKAESLDVEHFVRDDKAVVEIYGSPALANGRVYFTTRYDTYALGAKGTKPAPVAIAPMPAESGSPGAAAQLSKAALLLVPAEVALRPGQSVKFQARLFDDRGRLISNIGLADPADKSPILAPQLEVQGVAGEIVAPGIFKAADKPVFSSGLVTLQFPGTEASARVRVLPALPLTESFDDMKEGSLPPGWLGVDVKAVLAERDGGVVLQKKAEQPSAPYSRMQAYSHPPMPANYTVEADMLGVAREGARPILSDMGLINSRYVLIMLGHEQELRLVTWAPIPRLQKDVPFEYKPEVWYRAKMRVDLQGDKALVRGKVWPRDQKEPDNWIVEMTDSCPNKEGSPGLYAYTKGATPKRAGAPNFFDNYRVYVNE